MFNLRSFLIPLILVFSSASLFGGDTGKTGWSIFRKARSAKFKPVTVTPVMAVRGDLSGVFYNPAVLAMNIRREIFFLSELGMVDDMFGGAVYGHPLKDSAVAGGFVFYDAGTMELNWFENGKITSEEVSAQRDILGIISYGRKMSRVFCMGGTVKLAASRLFERASANAFAFDLGGLYLPAKYPRLSITGAIQNIGTSSKFIEKANPLPSTMFIGAGYFQDSRKGYFVSPGFDLTYIVSESRIIPEIGLEAGCDPYSINLGYRFSDEANWHIGFTLLKKNYDIAYAFLPGVNLDSTHRISIGYRFGKAHPARRID